MTENWIWLPDFASDLSMWEDDLVGVSPAADHTFVQYTEMAEHLESIFELKGLSKATHVVGWGLGAFALLCSADKRPKGQKWMLLSPFADLGSEDSNWTSQNLLFMARQAASTVEPVVNAFGELIQDEFGDWQEDWLDMAKKMPPKAISDGLFFLAQHRIENVLPVNPDEVQVLYGRMDTAVPPSVTLELKEFLPGVPFKERPKAGHWPPMLLF